MKFKQLNESIIKVPPELLDKLNLYVSSALATLYNNALEQSSIYLKGDKYDELKVKIERVMGKLQSQYGAKVLSKQSLDSIMNKTIELPFDAEKLLSQTNININSDAANTVLNTKIFLELSNSQGRPYKGQMSRMANGNIIISMILHANTHQPLKTVNDTMSSVNHEAQHVIQELIITNIEKSGKTTQHDNSTFDEYQSSYIEFGPHLSSIAGAIENVLESMKINNEYPQDPKASFKMVFEVAVKKDMTFMSFIKAVKEKDEQMYRKAIKQINKSYYELYDKIKQTDVNYAYSSLPSSELEANVNIMLSIYYIIKNNHNFELIGVKSDPNDKREFTILRCKLFDKIQFTFHKSKSKFMISTEFGNFKENEYVDAKDILSFMNSLQYVPTDDTDYVFSLYRSLLTSSSNITTDVVKEMIESTSNTINFFEVESSSTENTIVISGIDFKINPTEEQNSVIIESDKLDNLYLNVTLSQAENFLLVFAQCSARTNENNNPQIVKDSIAVLSDEISFMIIMDKLGELAE